MSDTQIPVKKGNWFIAFINWVKDGIAKVWKQIIAPFTDKQWDADAQKIVGFGVVFLGAWVIITAIIKDKFDGPGPQYGIALITLGVGLLGWRGHTDV